MSNHVARLVFSSVFGWIYHKSVFHLKSPLQIQTTLMCTYWLHLHFHQQAHIPLWLFPTVAFHFKVIVVVVVSQPTTFGFEMQRFVCFVLCYLQGFVCFVLCNLHGFVLLSLLFFSNCSCCKLLRRKRIEIMKKIKIKIPLIV